MKTLLSFFMMLALTFSLQAQVAINTDGSTPNSSAMLDVKSDTAGILIPRMTETQRDAISSPTTGLMVYVTDDNTFYYYQGSSWQKVGSGASGWSVAGNYVYLLNDSVGIGTSSPKAALDVAGRISFTNTGKSVFLGEEAGVNDDLSNNSNVFVGYWTGKHNTTGSYNTAIGSHSLYYNKASKGSVAIGYRAMHNTDDRSEDRWLCNTAIGYSALAGSSTPSNNTGRYNTSAGFSSMEYNASGENNTASGYYSLNSNSTGNNNTANGFYALAANTTGHSNVAIGIKALCTNSVKSNLVAIGDSALFNNGTGATDSIHATANTAVGSRALVANTIGYSNTASGYEALYSNIEGYKNTSNGSHALYSNTFGSYNTASGSHALYSNTYGSHNTASGSQALISNTGGDYNTANGSQALYSNTFGSYNTANGSQALFNNTTGYYNTANGNRALFNNTTGYYNTANGNRALYQDTTGYGNTALGHLAGFNNNGDSNVFIGHKAGYSQTNASNKLYIDNDDNTKPLIYGDFSSRRIGLGTITPQSKLEVISATGVDPLRVRIGSATKFRVHANGSVSVGTSSEGPVNGLESLGNIEPNTHKGADLGADGKAWDDIYYDDLHNQGASAFEGRNTSKEIVQFPPRPKQPGSLDYKTKTGDVELDPKSMPPGLADDNSLLTDEISSYNYKTNYQQQLLINKQRQEIDQLTKENKSLLKRLEKLEEKMK